MYRRDTLPGRPAARALRRADRPRRPHPRARRPARHRPALRRRPRTARCDCGAPLLWGSRFCASLRPPDRLASRGGSAGKPTMPGARRSALPALQRRRAAGPGVLPRVRRTAGTGPPGAVERASAGVAERHRWAGAWLCRRCSGSSSPSSAPARRSRSPTTARSRPRLDRDGRQPHRHGQRLDADGARADGATPTTTAPPRPRRRRLRPPRRRRTLPPSAGRGTSAAGRSCCSRSRRPTGAAPRPPRRRRPAAAACGRSACSTPRATRASTPATTSSSPASSRSRRRRRAPAARAGGLPRRVPARDRAVERAGVEIRESGHTRRSDAGAPCGCSHD